MKSSTHNKPGQEHQPVAGIRAKATDPVQAFRFTDNRPEAARAKQVQLMANRQTAAPPGQAPVQRMRIDMIYLHNGRQESMASVNSYEVPRQVLVDALYNRDLAQSSKLEIEEALRNGETREYREQYPEPGTPVPGAVRERYAHVRVNPYGVKEDEVNETLMPELNETELEASSGTLYFKGTKKVVTGTFRYGIHAGRGTLHIVPAGDGRFRHSSTVKSANVLSAGDMTVNGNGTIVYIDNNSGHYAPKADFFINGMRHLYHNGYLVPGKFRFGINDGTNFPKYSTAQSAQLLLTQQAPQQPVVQAPPPGEVITLD